MNDTDILLSKQTKICENLRVYCLKLIRSKEKSLREVAIKYININRATWFKFLKEEFATEITPKQFVIPPQIEEHKQM
jgi:hypothetical protein